MESSDVLVKLGEISGKLNGIEVNMISYHNRLDNFMRDDSLDKQQIRKDIQDTQGEQKRQGVWIKILSVGVLAGVISLVKGILKLIT